MFLTKVERRLCFHPLHHLCWLEGNANYDHTNLVPTHAWEWPCSWTDQNSESHAALVAAKNGGSFKVPLPILAPNDCPITKNWTSNRLPVESPSLHGNAPVGIILVQKKTSLQCTFRHLYHQRVTCCHPLWWGDVCRQILLRHRCHRRTWRIQIFFNSEGSRS